MALPKILQDNLAIPVIGAPLFLVSGPELVIAQCKAGVVGSFPALNARPQELLSDWIKEIKDELGQYKEDNPDMERYFGNQAPATMYGKPKQSDGFKEVMSKIQQDHPRANLSNYT